MPRVPARWLLLLYSLSPGLAKLAGAEALFGVGLLFLMVYFASIPPGADPLTHAAPRRHVMPRAPLLCFVAYGAILGIGLCFAGVADTRAAIVGAFNFLVPLLIVAAAGPSRAARLLHDLPFVATVHALLALLMFAPLRPSLAAVESLSETLLTGTAAFRLSSVSGSLALSTTMVAAFGVALHRHVQQSGERGGRIGLLWLAAALFLLCGFLSLQRAAWLSLALIWLAGVASAAPGRRRSVLALVTVVALPVAGALAWLEIPQDAVEIFLDRFATLTGGGEVGAVAERSGQWLNVTYNLLLLPIGHGPGQLGQPVRDFGPFTGGLPIFDGDYFRIVSEYGVVGMALLVLLAAGGWRAARRLQAGLAAPRPQPVVLAAATLGLLLQCVGTNVTELYFANAVFWSLWLQCWAAAPAARAPGV